MVGKGAHGGGRRQRSVAQTVRPLYAARHLAKNIVAAGLASEVLVQLVYVTGVAWVR